MGNITQNIFHLICVKDYRKPEDYDENIFSDGLKEIEDFLNNFGGDIEIRQKSVLDVGCGFGSACIYTALNGAARVTGIDIDKHRIDFAKSKLAAAYANLTDQVDFRLTDELKDEKFDIIISKDSFEHYDDPENFLLNIKQYLNPSGKILVGFGPLWKAPYGGHISYMTRLPWAHLLFPESVIMSERKRFWPNENASSFAQVRGGLNKMTYKRYVNIIKESGLIIESLKTNVATKKSSKNSLALFKILRKVPFCQEYFTQNIYSVLHA